MKVHQKGREESKEWSRHESYMICSESRDCERNERGLSIFENMHHTCEGEAYESVYPVSQAENSVNVSPWFDVWKHLEGKHINVISRFLPMWCHDLIFDYTWMRARFHDRRASQSNFKTSNNFLPKTQCFHTQHVWKLILMRPLLQIDMYAARGKMCVGPFHCKGAIELHPDCQMVVTECSNIRESWPDKSTTNSQQLPTGSCLTLSVLCARVSPWPIRYREATYARTQ